MDPRNSPPGYEKKFAGFIKGIAESKAGGIESMIIAHPWVIGDNYEEVMESLSRLAAAGLSLRIVEPMGKIGTS